MAAQAQRLLRRSSTRPISRSPSSVASRRMRRLSSGSRCQARSSMPVARWNVRSRCFGSVGDLRVPQRPPAVFGRPVCQWDAMRTADSVTMDASFGRRRRMRRSSEPSSRTADGAGSAAAGRPEEALTRSRASAPRVEGAPHRGQRRLGGEGPERVASRDLDDLGALGAGMAGVPTTSESATDGLDALVVGAGVLRGLDHRVEARLEVPEQVVLLVDRQRQQPVEEPRHRRQRVLQAAFGVGQDQSGGFGEAFLGPARHMVVVDGQVHQPQRGERVRALEVVLGAEQRRLAHRRLAVALAAGDGAEAVEAARDGGDEAPLALDVGGDGPEQRRARLPRAVRAAEPLDRHVGAPAGLEQVVDAPRLVRARGVGVVAAPGAAGGGEDQDLLRPVHERGGLRQVGGRRPGGDGVADAAARWRAARGRGASAR